MPPIAPGPKRRQARAAGGAWSADCATLIRRYVIFRRLSGRRLRYNPAFSRPGYFYLYDDPRIHS
jgi:hypothetical protein